MFPQIFYLINEFDGTYNGKNNIEIATVDDVEAYWYPYGLYRDDYPEKQYILEGHLNFMLDENKIEEASNAKKCLDILARWYACPSWKGAGAGKLFCQYQDITRYISNPTQQQQRLLWQIIRRMYVRNINMPFDYWVLVVSIITIIENLLVYKHKLIRDISALFCCDVSNHITDYLNFPQEVVLVVGLEREQQIYSRIIEIIVLLELFDQNLIQRLIQRVPKETNKLGPCVFVEKDYFIPHIDKFMQYRRIIAPCTCYEEIHKHTNDPIICYSP